MASTSYNNIIKSIAPNSLFDDATPAVTSAVSWNQGDLLFLDTTNHLIKPIATASSDSTTFLGVARVKLVSGVLPSPYQGTAVDASEKPSGIPGPVEKVVAELTLNTGDAFHFGDPVYSVNSNPQTVTSTSAGTLIGYFQGGTVASASAGQKGNVFIVAALGN